MRITDPRIDHDKKDEAYVRADQVLQLYAQHAPLHALFESSTEYRKRLARIVQIYAKPFNNVRLDSLDPDSYEAIESEIYKCAAKNAQAELDEVKGRLIPIKRTDEAGRTITEWRGDIDVWLGNFKMQPKRIRFRRPKAVGGVIVGLER